MIGQTRKELGIKSPKATKPKGKKEKKYKPKQRMFGIEIEGKTAESASLIQLFKNINKSKYTPPYAKGTPYTIFDMLTNMESAKGRLSAGHVPNFIKYQLGQRLPKGRGAGGRHLAVRDQNMNVHYDPAAMFHADLVKRSGLEGKTMDGGWLFPNGRYEKIPGHDGSGLQAEGHVPNFANLDSKAKKVLSKHPEYAKIAGAAMKREASFGVTPVLTTSPGLGSPGNLAVVNKEQERGSASIAKKLHGSNFKKDTMSSRGHVPNFADPFGGGADIGDPGPSLASRAEAYVHKNVTKKVNVASWFGDIGPALARLEKKHKTRLDSLDDEEKLLGRVSNKADKAQEKFHKATTTLQELKESSSDTSTTRGPDGKKRYVDPALEAARVDVEKAHAGRVRAKQNVTAQEREVGRKRGAVNSTYKKEEKVITDKAKSREGLKNQAFQASFVLPMITGQLQQLAGESSKFGKILGGCR